MDINKLSLKDFMFEGTKRGSFLLKDQEELIQTANRIREEKGYLDVPSEENEVYYNFYLTFDCDERSLKLTFTVNNSKVDDYEEYNIPIENENQQKVLLWKITEDLYNNLARQLFNDL